MRISDWSSDVCSSDLTKPALFIGRGAVGPAALALHDGNEAVAPAVASVDRDLTGADFAADRRRGVPAVAAARDSAGCGAVVQGRNNGVEGKSVPVRLGSGE